MEQIVYVLVAKNFYTSQGIEYACVIASPNIALRCSYADALEALCGGQKQLMDKGYYVVNSANEDNTYGRQHWVRLENGKGRAAVLEILRKSVSGELTQVYHD